MGLSQEVDAHEWPHNLSQNINIHLWLRTNRINKWDPFLALVNLVEKNKSTDVMDAAQFIFLMLKGVTMGKKKMHYCKSDSDSSDTTPERSDYPCQFCHNNFINL